MHPKRTISRDCQQCGQPFDAVLFDVNRGFGRFCSRLCARKGGIRRKYVSRSPVADRFWSRAVVVGDCLEWQGARFSNGYGVFWMDNRNARAHRVAYELANGPIPAGLYVCHRCDNPPCVRPEHLFLGMPLDNRRDMIAKGREYRQRRAAS